MKKEQPVVLQQISYGNFDLFFDWLSEKIYRFGAKLSTRDLIQQAVGENLDSESYLSYLREKYIDSRQ